MGMFDTKEIITNKIHSAAVNTTDAATYYESWKQIWNTLWDNDGIEDAFHHEIYDATHNVTVMVYNDCL